MYWVYILCSNKHGTLYIGITNNIIRRIYEHKQKIIKVLPQNMTLQSLFIQKNLPILKKHLLERKI